MFAKLFRGCRDESGSNSSSHKLKQALEKLEEKEIVLQKKIAMEVERYKEFTKANNKQAAMQCLKRKKFYEVQIEHIGSFQLRIHDKEQKLLHNSPVSCREVQKMPSKKSSLKSNTALVSSMWLAKGCSSFFLLLRKLEMNRLVVTFAMFSPYLRESSVLLTRMEVSSEG